VGSLTGAVARLRPWSERVKRAFQVHVLGFSRAALPAPAFEYRGEAAERYDERRAAREVFQWEAEVIERLLREHTQDTHGATVLDAPVGTGRFIPIYLEQGLRVTGLDLSEDMLREAALHRPEEAGALELVKGSTTSLPFPDATFDAVISFRFLPGKLNLVSVRKSLREFARVTRGKAYLLLKVAEEPVDRTWRDRWSRLGERTMEEFEVLLGDAGYAIETVERAPSGPKAVFVCRPRHERGE